MTTKSVKIKKLKKKQQQQNNKKTPRSKGVLCSSHVDRQLHTQTYTKVNIEYTLSGFQEFFLHPIIMDRSNIDNGNAYTEMELWKCWHVFLKWKISEWFKNDVQHIEKRNIVII